MVVSEGWAKLRRLRREMSMTRQALSLLAVIIGMTSLAQAQITDRPIQGQGAGQQKPFVNLCTVGNADSFADAVKVLKLPFVKDAQHDPQGDPVPEGAFKAKTSRCVWAYARFFSKRTMRKGDRD